MPLKKISWFLIAAGLITFLIGIYQLNTIPDSVAVNRNAFIVSTTQLFTFEGLTAISLILIGLGSYVAGQGKEGPSTSHFTLDFTRKMESSRSASSKVRPS